MQELALQKKEGKEISAAFRDYERTVKQEQKLKIFQIDKLQCQVEKLEDQLRQKESEIQQLTLSSLEPSLQQMNQSFDQHRDQKGHFEELDDEMLFVEQNQQTMGQGWEGIDSFQQDCDEREEGEQAGIIRFASFAEGQRVSDVDLNHAIFEKQ